MPRFAVMTKGPAMTELGSEAVVLGAGMAGLLTARVLSEFYRAVTVVERDFLLDQPAQRKGVPQGRHLHNFLSRGPQVLAVLFPGILDELVAAGAVVVDIADLSRIYARIGRYELYRTGKLADPSELVLYQASRPFMEFHVRRRVCALGNVTVLDGHEAIEPLTAGGAVTGMRITNRGNGIDSVLNADLVVDAMGRGTRTPAFLKAQGLDTPPESGTASTWAYSSQLMRIPHGRITERMVFINEGRRVPLGLMVAYEHNTWMLAIARSTDSGNPPADFTEALAAAEQILPATIMSALWDAKPIGDIAISRNTAALWRRYDRMPRFPAGLIAIGDALCNLNPIYGQGMTMAALQALALRDSLRVGTADLPQRFFDAAAGHIAPVWAMNQANDRPPSTRTRRGLRRPLAKWIGNAALKAAASDVTVAERFLRVRNLIDPPTGLQNPALLSRILLANLRNLRPVQSRGNPARRQSATSDLLR
jgi:2-polyprenyl-6-methoxyphenol hydroxylase-like FAD-dependent oxidoreductase